MLCSTKAKSRTWVQLNVYFPSTLKCIDKIKMYMYTPVQNFGNSKMNVFVCLFIHWFIDLLIEINKNLIDQKWE